MSTSDQMHPELVTFLTRRVDAMGRDELIDLPLPDARRAFRDRWLFDRGALPECSVQDLALPGGPGLRLYAPKGADPAEVILFIHGGGWTFGDLDSHDLLMRNLCLTTGARVVGVDYRLSPEIPYPGPVHDCQMAAQWISTTLRPGHLTLVGDSAGANLALSCAIGLNQDGPAPDALMLLYGCFRPECDTGSYATYGDGRFGLSERAMRRYWDNYLGASDRAAYGQQIRKALAGLPPVFLGVAALDLLRDDSLWLADQLVQSQVAHRLRLWPGCPHGFLQLPATLTPVGAALHDIAEACVSLRNPLRPCD